MSKAVLAKKFSHPTISDLHLPPICDLSGSILEKLKFSETSDGRPPEHSEENGARVPSSGIFPRLIGSRMNIGPVAATAGVLFWGWLWGLIVVFLAIPIDGTDKTLSQTVILPSRTLSSMLGEASEYARHTDSRRPMKRTEK